MNRDKHPSPDRKDDSSATRRRRQADALRANLRRRKEAGRNDAEGGDAHSRGGDGDSPRGGAGGGKAP